MYIHKSKKTKVAEAKIYEVCMVKFGAVGEKNKLITFLLILRNQK